jgi:hypothetical protein
VRGLPELHLSALAYTIDHWVLDIAEESRGELVTHRFDFSAPYQRGSVWTLDQRKALIKSIYTGLPVGSITVAALPFKHNGASWRIVDGKQRVETVRAFVRDEFAVPGAWFRDHDLDESLEGFNVYFSDLTKRGQRSFRNRQLAALEFDSQKYWAGRDAKGESVWVYRTEEQMLLAEAELYLLINKGGTPHTADDLARAAGLLEDQ